MLRTALFTVATIIITASSAASETFTLKSNTIAEGQQLKTAQVFQGFDCKGDNIAPEL